jgi:NAD(P)-dependent dehydrogenase (short-subunit alcohol dehydrogenase family)
MPWNLLFRGRIAALSAYRRARPPMHQDWTTQHIVVTGAASGLGRAICVRFVSLGASVRGIDINKDQLQELQAVLGKKFVPEICDVANWDQVVLVFGRFPPADVLVNCAGITGRTNIKSHETDPAEVERVFRVNFFGSYHTSKVVLPQMLAHGYGRLLHIASIAGKEGNAGMIAYSASKAAVIGMTKVQGKEVAGTGVTVNALAPAVIETPMVHALPDQQVKYMTDKIPMGRCGSLDELAAMVEFIVSPSCSFTTGFTFDLTGGRATY